jgi:Kef-type K+ transport system membrane component KefB
MLLKNISTPLNSFFKKQLKTEIMKSKRLIIILTVVVFLLLIPFVAMQFTREVDWKTSDFVIMGILLLGTGLLCELAMSKIKRIKHKVLICGAILFAFFIIWAELAVGILGTPFAGS